MLQMPKPKHNFPELGYFPDTCATPRNHSNGHVDWRILETKVHYITIIYNNACVSHRLSRKIKMGDYIPVFSLKVCLLKR